MEALPMQNVIDSIDVQRVVMSAAERGMSDKQGLAGEIEAFAAMASVSRVPVEVVRCKPGHREAMPLSRIGKTHVRYVGKAPDMSVEPDSHGNPLIVFTGPGVVEVVFNSEKVRAHGRNRGAHGQKKIYICE